ncbi:MAG: DNA alkylation repair protein [Erysipelotrichaceae bacterium]
MNTTAANSLLTMLAEQANLEEARRMEAYMVDHFTFYGVRQPQRLIIFRTWKRLYPIQSRDWELITFLWNHDMREAQYLALDILQASKAYAQPSDLVEIKALIRNKAWWDSVDVLAAHHLGHLLAIHPNMWPELLSWLTDEDVWIRRSVILAQLRFKEKTDTKILSQAILVNSNDSDFFIRKAIGWSLREYAKTDATWVIAFVKAHPDLSPLSKKEALKHQKTE